MIFIDGVGIGENDPSKNPFFQREFAFLHATFDETPHLKNQELEKNNKFVFPVDANLGVEGLPQSGTGQTAIFCGINAAKKIGKHFGPYPYSSLVPIIKEENIFKKLIDQKKRVMFANAYPKVFFEYLKSGGRRLSVTSLSYYLTGLRLNTSTDVWRGNALTAEITNRRWNERLKYKLPQIKPETAAKRLIKISSQNDFTLYEYFLTDHVGHWRIKPEREIIFEELDRFLSYIIKNLPDKLTLLICSDHGNLEDISVKTHTQNPALAISAGRFGEYLFQNIKSLPHIRNAVINIING